MHSQVVHPYRNSPEAASLCGFDVDTQPHAHESILRPPASEKRSVSGPMTIIGHLLYGSATNDMYTVEQHLSRASFSKVNDGRFHLAVDQQQKEVQAHEP